MRGTNHNSRGRKKSNKGFTPKHNDRNYDTEKATNLISKSDDNYYYNVIDNQWYLHTERDNFQSFEDAEAIYYRKHFTKQYGQQMQRHEQKGNYKRIKSFEEWRSNKRYCPEETYFQLGMAGVTVDKDTFKKIALAYINMLQEYSKEHNNCFTILDASIQFDEAVPQMHIRRVWHSKDPETGVDEIGQDKALERAGIECPKPLKDGEKPSRYNNRKQTFDAEIRGKLLDLCDNYGLDIEREPIPNVKHNLTKGEAIAQKYEWLRSESERYEINIAIKEQKESELDEKISHKSKKIKELDEKGKKLSQQCKDKKAELDDIKQTIRETMENWTDLQKQVALEVARKQKQRNDNLIETIDKPVEFEKQTSVTKDREY